LVAWLIEVYIFAYGYDLSGKLRPKDRYSGWFYEAEIKPQEERKEEREFEPSELGVRRGGGCRMDLDQYFILFGSRRFHFFELKSIWGAVFRPNDRFHLGILPYQFISLRRIWNVLYHSNNDFSVGVAFCEVAHCCGQLAQRVLPVDERGHFPGLEKFVHEEQIFSIQASDEEDDFLPIQDV
jgi:hypothetical protein